MHAAICVITSILGAMWPSVAAMPPLTPIYNKKGNTLDHRNYGDAYHETCALLGCYTASSGIKSSGLYVV
jgi:hypothetical protein